MDIREYFRSILPPNHKQHTLNVRIGNALHRAGVKTMNQLCRMDESELRHIRNLGEKGLKVALRERQKYMNSRDNG